MKTNNKANFEKVILITLATAGILTIAVLAPNVIQVLKPFLKDKKYNKKHYINQKIKKLEKDGLLKVLNKNGKKFAELTEKGKKKLLYLKLKEKKEGKWDGKWRVVVFDVWENARSKRNTLRKEIKDYGFIQLQRSVWIYPYECSDFIELLKTDLSFGKNIRYMIVDKLDYDEALRKYFKLI